MRGTNDHGSGCLLAAAIAAGPAKGDGLLEHVTAAEAYVARALAGSATWRLGAKATAPSTTSAGQWEKDGSSA